MITGATGFIGQNLARAWIQGGHEVHALMRPRSQMPSALAGVVKHSYEGQGADIRRALSVAQPEVVVHLASLFLAEHKFEHIPQLCESNLSFGTQLVDAMVEASCLNLVAAGTAWQNFDGRQGTATNLYAATKEAFEAILKYYAHAASLRAIVLKLNDTYGPGDTRRKLVSILRDAGRNGQPIGLSPGDQKLDLLHVRDVVRAFQVAAQRVGGIEGLQDYYLRSGRLVSVKELVDIFNRHSGLTIEARFGERPYRAREVMEPWSQGEELPGWQPTITLEDGLREFVQERGDV